MKKDIKYIIKRVIICVLVALILAFIHNKSVFADEPALTFCYSSAGDYVYSNENCSTNYQYSYDSLLYTTPAGDVIWRFLPLTNTYGGISIFLENASNGDYLIINAPCPAFNSWFSTLDTIGIQDLSNNDVPSYYLQYYISPFILEEYATLNGAKTIFITQDYSRSLDYRSSNAFSLYAGSNQIGDYYFVYGDFAGNSGILDYFDISSDWVYNQLNFSTFFNPDTQTGIEFLDSSGNPDFTINITDSSNNISLPPINDYWEQGFIDGGDTFINDSCSNGGLCATNIVSLIDFLKIPFDFVKGLNRDNCSPITITIPFVNSNMSLPCLSSIFSSTLGSFYNVIFLIFTGLYAYRITIRNIDTITDIFDPIDDKLEVLEL